MAVIVRLVMMEVKVMVLVRGWEVWVVGRRGGNLAPKGRIGSFRGRSSGRLL
jgi:hypothetical protein